ncbi:MAG TPA: hypothetical protein VKA82_15690 [Rubrobacter sp.]|jgi:hypothetical protein|nr:hypothetical protein [Rubrobacter sp.]
MIREAGRWATEAFWMLVERFDAFLFDLDGVVYLGEESLPGSARPWSGSERPVKRCAS